MPGWRHGDSIVLRPASEYRRWVREEMQQRPLTGSRLATLHLLGSRESRRWPIERFVDLALRLRNAHGLVPCLIGSQAERQHLEHVANAFGGAPVITPPDHEATAARLAQTALVVGNDTGVMH